MSDGDHTAACSSSSRHAPPALDLLDDCWFFSNTLAVSSSSTKKKPPLLPRSPAPSSAKQQQDHRQQRRLLRTPSLPSPRVNRQQDPAPVVAVEEEEEEVDDDDLNWSSIYQGVLRTRMAEGSSNSKRSPGTLRRAPSMPVPSSATPGLSRPSSQTAGERITTPAAGQRRLDGRPPSMSRSSRHRGGVVRSKSAFFSSSSGEGDLEALARVQSAAEMKDQLRMWAQAVASNVRQDIVTL